MNTNDLKRLGTGCATRHDGAPRGRSALADRAAGEGLVDVAVATMDSPIGELFVAVTPQGAGVDRVRGRGPRRGAGAPAREVSPRVLEAAAPTDEARRELERVLRGGTTPVRRAHRPSADR